MTPRAYAYLILALAIAGGLYTIKHLYDQNAELSAANSKLEAERDAARNETQRLDLLLAEKLRADAATARELARLRNSFIKEKEDDPELREWAETPLPDGVYRILYGSDADPPEPVRAD